MSHMKPGGYWKCRACGNVCQGEQLVQDPMSIVLKWTCPDCGGTCDNLDPKYIVAKLNSRPTKDALDLPSATVCSCGAANYDAHKKWCITNTASQ